MTTAMFADLECVNAAGNRLHVTVKLTQAEVDIERYHWGTPRTLPLRLNALAGWHAEQKVPPGFHADYETIRLRDAPALRVITTVENPT